VTGIVRHHSAVACGEGCLTRLRFRQLIHWPLLPCLPLVLRLDNPPHPIDRIAQYPPSSAGVENHPIKKSCLRSMLIHLGPLLPAIISSINLCRRSCDGDACRSSIPRPDRSKLSLSTVCWSNPIPSLASVLSSQDLSLRSAHPDDSIVHHMESAIAGRFPRSHHLPTLGLALFETLDWYRGGSHQHPHCQIRYGDPVQSPHAASHFAILNSPIGSI
jgi:hypothetical protein